MRIPELANSRFDQLITLSHFKERYSNGHRVYLSFLTGHVDYMRDTSEQYKIVKQISSLCYQKVNYYNEEKIQLLCDPGSDFFLSL